MHLLGDGVGDSTADAAADNTDLLEAVHLGGLAERAYDIGDEIALLDGVEHFRGAAGRLNHDGNGALFPVIARDGDGNAFALLIQTEDDKLTRLRMARDQGRFNLKQANGLCIVEKSFGYYFIHFSTSY